MALKPCSECGREISTEAKTCPHCGKKDPTGRPANPFGVGCLVIIVIALLVNVFSSNSDLSTPSSSSNSAPESPSSKEQALSLLRLDYEWSKEGFENVMVANFTITNPTSYAVKDVEITCTHFAASGTRIDENTRTVYEIVPANGKKRVPKFNMGLIHSQVKSSSCRITDFVLD
jgi:RNA polymerase subunit RPABC4/transcription elongation factor Spt4